MSGPGQGTVDGGTGDDGANQGMSDAAVIPPDACGDTDSDGVCNAVDKCAGHDDKVDSDADTVADGCDLCPNVDDRPDLNANMVADCSELQTRTIDLKSVAGNLWRGWHASNGGHLSSNENTLTGVYSTATHNSYYVFSLAGLNATVVTGVTLQLQLELYTSTDANETLSVWDVSASSSDVENLATSATIFNDLQSGNQYATSTVTSAQLNQILSIPLAAQAATDVKAKLGTDIVFGVHLDTAPGYIRFGHTGPDAAPTVIRLVVQYLP